MKVENLCTFIRPEDRLDFHIQPLKVVGPLHGTQTSATWGFFSGLCGVFFLISPTKKRKKAYLLELLNTRLSFLQFLLTPKARLSLSSSLSFFYGFLRLISHA